MKSLFQPKFIPLLLITVLAMPSLAYAEMDTLSLKNMSLNELANLDVIVTSASKKPQKLSKTAAAVFVISQDDIRKSGVTTIPDALRMAPGLHVARIDVNKWSVTSRGFSGRFANKLLVMIDGRTIYNPLFSGVYWDSHNAQLENIERIEVIRGPGAAMWGANAVNGVINIITQTAQQSEGTMIRAGIGSEVKEGFIRHGGKLGDFTQYRLYADYSNHDDSIDNQNEDTADNWDQGQAGARLDWQVSSHDTVTLQADYYEGEAGHNNATKPRLTPPYSTVENERIKLQGANFISRWNHRYSEDNKLELKFYYDYVNRDSESFKQRYDTFDFELNHQYRHSAWNEVNWGVGYRVIYDELKGYDDLTLDPIARNSHLFSGYIQDELTLIPDTLTSIFAIRVEHNDYSGIEFQPTARLLWTPHKQHSFWSAFSRAVRTPSRSTEIRIDQRTIPGAPPRLVSIFGNPDIDSEEVFAYELGYKFNFSNQFNLNLSAFYNIYDELRTFERGTPAVVTSPAPVHVVIPVFSNNKMEGETYGVEISSTWHVNDFLTLNGAYTYTKLSLHYKDNSLDTTSISAETETPQQQFSLRSDLKLTSQWSTNFWLRYVDSLPAQQIKAYVTLDARLAWQAHEQIELSLVGQNLLDSEHPEYNPEILSISPSQVERSILGNITWKF